MGELVAKRYTPWATPGDHHEIVVNMDSILRDAGIVDEAHVRRRLTAHAIVASGWRQACYNFNAWKVKLGKWTGDYFQSDTTEEVGGVLVPEKGTKWRSYGSFAEAVENHPVFSMGRYAGAKAALIDDSRQDADYWAELGAAGYYTDTHNMTPAKFASLCRRVSAELGAEDGGEDTRPFSLLPVFVVFAAVTGVALCLVGIAKMRGEK